MPDTGDKLLDMFLAAGAALDQREKATRQVRPWKADQKGPAGEPGNRPGDDFNRRTDLAEQLAALGWKLDHVRGDVSYWTRPGKARGVSASLGQCKTGSGLPRLYVFTSNAAPLEPNTSYDAFGLYAALNHGGDPAAAARALADQGLGEPSPEPCRIIGGKIDKGKGGPAPAPGRRPGKPAPVPKWKPFPTAALPGPLAAYVRECAGAIGCDEAAVAVPLLATFAGLIGNRRRLQVDPTWEEPCCLWAAVVGRTGTMKSPAWRAADRVANEIDRELEERSGAARAQWKERKESGDPDPGPRPPSEKLIVEDITTESVAATLADNPAGLLVSMDELSVWFDLFTRYRKGGGSDANRWLGMWEGRRLKVSRRMSGELYVPSALVSVVGTIQPGILARLVREEDRESGFLARLLLAKPPELPKRWTGRRPSAAALGEVVSLARDLHEMREAAAPFAADSFAAWVDYYNLTGAAEWTAGNEDERAALAKGPRLALRLALIHHCCTTGKDDGEAGLSPVGLDSVRFGCELADWFIQELRRVYLAMARTGDDITAVVEWIRRQPGQCAKPAELVRARRDKFNDVQAARSFLDMMAEAGAGSWEDKDGREKALFCLLPERYDDPAEDGE